ncbi:MAG: hypothetical protein ACLFWH_07065 [Actinomycetota bacterium]
MAISGAATRPTSPRFRAELMGEISGLRTELKTDIVNLRAEVTFEIAALRKQMGNWMLTLMVTIVGAMAGISAIS